MKKTLFLLLTPFLLANGCASIMCSAEKTVNIQSTPPGARFEILDPVGKTVTTGQSPANVTLKRGRGWFKAAEYTVRFSKDGYHTVTLPIRQEWETGWYIGGNIVFGGLIGIVIVDPLTGAMWTLDDVSVRLRPEPVVWTPGT